MKQSNASPERQRERLAAKIPDDRSGCWEWTGSRTSKGYGLMRTGPGQRDYVHRISYRLNVGDIPEGAELDHLCRNPPCFNPEHLEAVSPRTNFIRGEHATAVAHRTDICRNGHALTPENSMIHAATGRRRCRRCNYEWQKARRARRAEPTTP